MPRIRTHPGEILREEYLVPLGMSARALAKALGVPANRITDYGRDYGRDYGITVTVHSMSVAPVGVGEEGARAAVAALGDFARISGNDAGETG